MPALITRLTESDSLPIPAINESASQPMSVGSARTLLVIPKPESVGAFVRLANQITPTGIASGGAVKLPLAAQQDVLHQIK
jgi:hypothetical protein